MRSLYSGVAGLKTHQSKMDVIGNNIANVNTVAFKSSSVTFQDIMYQTQSGASGATATVGGINAQQTGLGVSTGSTKMSIDSAGAAQSTGEAFDIKLTDSQSTNFFIVNNGNQNMFTRAGSFYIDGAGNLAMTSTGYLVQGWQAVEDSDGSIRIQKDKVSALRIMQPSNLTSSPEATENATVSGIIDKNDSSITSNDGYYMSLGFYDSLGYLYTAKFAVKAYDVDNYEYTASLVSIIDDKNNDILAQFTAGDGNTLDEIFGSEVSTAKDSFTLGSKFSYAGNTISTTFNNTEYELDVTTATPVKYTSGIATNDYKDTYKTTGESQDMRGYVFTDPTNPTQTLFISLADMGYGVNARTEFGTDKRTFAQIMDDPQSKTNTSTGETVTETIGINKKTGALEVVYFDINYHLKFNSEDGSFAYVGADGQESVDLNVDALNSDGNFHAIDMNFSEVINVDNGGSATAGIDTGSVEDPSVGAGKKLGALTSLSVQQNGQIYGSYDNGNTVLLGQIAVAQFTNPSGLEALGNNLYSETLNSGSFDGIGVEVTADGGSMQTGQLEMSNVDLSKEFTEMITTQRGFQANSRIITVSDTMLEELTNLKR